MEQLTFFVEFPPTAWKRPAGKTQRYDSQSVEKNAFALLVMQQLKGLLKPISKEPHFPQHRPLEVVLSFCFKHPGSSKLGMPTNKVDIDNLCKFVLDALQSGILTDKIWHDDGQVVCIHAKKYWAENDLISCTIKEYFDV